MKIEKLSKDNIKEFIRNMKLDDAELLEINVDKSELYGVKKDDTFCLGFDSLTLVDTIAIFYYSPKMSNDLFYECIDFLDKSLVVENHLIIDVYDDKLMKLLDDEYKCKDMIVSLLSNNDDFKECIREEKYKAKEKFIDIEMKSIKYNYSKEIIMCNLVKQNIQDEKLIFNLHEYFKELNVNNINFIIFPDSYDYFKTLDYKCVSKSYVIRND